MKINIPIIILLSAFLLPISISAHPGKTDYRGGHYDHSTGEYHYHHGYPAHQHPNGVCPYNFNDKTGSTSGSSSGSSTKKYDDFKAPPPPTPEPTLLPTSKPTTSPTSTPIINRIQKFTSTKKFKEYSASVGMALLLILGIWFLVRLRKKEYITPEIIITKYKRSYIEPLIDLSKFAKVPVEYAIDENGLPYRKNRQYGWGKEFNAFVTPYGKVFHRSNCQSLHGKRKILIHRYKALKKYRPCSFCKPLTHKALWYKEIDYSKV